MTSVAGRLPTAKAQAEPKPSVPKPGVLSNEEFTNVWYALHQEDDLVFENEYDMGALEGGVCCTYRLSGLSFNERVTPKILARAIIQFCMDRSWFDPRPTSKLFANHGFWMQDYRVCQAVTTSLQKNGESLLRALGFKVVYEIKRPTDGDGHLRFWMIDMISLAKVIDDMRKEDGAYAAAA